MAIVTTAEVKTFCQISVSTYDTLIATLIPVVQDWLINYLHNRFKNADKYVSGISLAFVDGGESADTITDSDSNFVEADFTDGIHVCVEGSIDNDGIYKVGTVAAGTLTLDSGETLTDESAGESVYITKVKFPDAIKMAFSQLVYYDIQKSTLAANVAGEKIGNYSVTYVTSKDSSGSSGRYPKSLLDGFAPWKKLGWE